MSPSRPVTRGRSSASAPETPSLSSKRLQNLSKTNYTGLDLNSTDSQPYEQSDGSDELGSPMDTSSDVPSPLPPPTAKLQRSTPSNVSAKNAPIAFSYPSRLPQPKAFAREISQLSSEAFRTTLQIAYDVPRWTSDQMSAYIDSLLRNFKFNSALYFNKVHSPPKKVAVTPQRIILEGHLQLKALELFMTGQIACHDSSDRPWFFCDVSKQTPGIQTVADPARLVLSSEVSEQFKKLQIDCFEYDNVPKHIQDQLRSYLVPGIGLNPTGASQQEITSIEVAKEAEKSNLNPDKSQIAPEPQATKDWVDFAKTLEDTYSISGRLHVDKDAAQSTILACLATIFEIGIASSESRTPGYRPIGTLDSRSLSSNRLFILNKAFERFSSFLPDEVPSTSDATMLLSQAETVAAFALVYHFMDVCNDEQLIDHIITLRSRHRQASNGEDVSDEHLWAAAWETIQCIENAKLYKETQDAKIIGGSHPCKPCSDSNKTCDRRRPECDVCSRRNVPCEWLSLTDINRRRTEEACLECKEKHRACDRKRSTCDTCRTRNIECHWAEKSQHGISADQNNPAKAGEVNKTILDCITVSEGSEQKRKAACTRSPQLTKRPRVFQPNSSMTAVAQEIRKMSPTETPSVNDRTTVLPQLTKTSAAPAPKPRSKSPDSVILSDSSDDEPLSRASSMMRATNSLRTDRDYATGQNKAVCNDGAELLPKSNGGQAEPIRQDSGNVNNTDQVTAGTVQGLHALNKATLSINNGVDLEGLRIESGEGSSLPPAALRVEPIKPPVIAKVTRNAIDLRDTPMASEEELPEATSSGQNIQAKAIETQVHTMKSQEERPVLNQTSARIAVSPIAQTQSPSNQRDPPQKLIKRSSKVGLVSQSPDSAKPTKPMSDMMKALARKREKRAQEERTKK